MNVFGLLKNFNKHLDIIFLIINVNFLLNKINLNYKI